MSDDGQGIRVRGFPSGMWEVSGNDADKVALVAAEISVKGLLASSSRPNPQLDLPLVNGDAKNHMESGTARNGATVSLPTRSRRRRALTFGASHADPTPDEIKDFYQKWVSGKNRGIFYTAREVSYRLRYLEPEHVKLTRNLLMRCGARQVLNADGTRCRRQGCDVLTCVEE